MFGRKERKALEALPPLHHQLAVEHQLVGSQPPAEWRSLLTSLTHHDASVHKHPLPPRTLDMVVPLVKVILEDVPDDSYLGLRLDLRGSDAPGKAGPTQKIPPTPPALDVDQHIEFDPWLSLEARLTNKAKLDLWVADVVRVRKIRKRGSSGKIKYKTKRKATQRVRVRLAVPAGVAVAAPASGAPSWLSITMERDERHTVLDARARYGIAVPAHDEGRLARMLAVREPASGPDAAKTGPWQFYTVMLALASVFRWVPPSRPAEAAG